MTQFSQHEVEMIVDRAVNKTLASLGLDLSDPKGVRYAQADFQFLRKQREGSEKMVDWAKRSVITAAIGGTLMALWAGIVLLMQRPHT